jgi:hypothetical protein
VWIPDQSCAGLDVPDRDGGTLSATEPDASTPPNDPDADDDAVPDETNKPTVGSTTSTSTFEELPGGGYRVTRRTVTTRRTVVDDRIEEDVEELLPGSAYRAPSVPGHPPAVG